MFRVAILGATLLGVAGLASATTLRMVTYNIDCDTPTYQPNGIPPAATLQTIANAIASQTLAGNAQPIDVLSLQELNYSNSTPSVTLQAITADLNNIYGAGMYAYDTFVGYTDGNNVGNGPNGLIYNTRTVVDLGAVGVIDPDDVNGDGAARQPIRYELCPQGYGDGAKFYLYNDHFLARASGDRAQRRTIEADAIRQDADSLGPNVHIIWTGDYNLAGYNSHASSTGSAEQAYQDMIAPAGSTLDNGETAGPEPAHDPLSTTFLNDTNSAAYIKYYTEAGDDLTARFDFQLVSGAMIGATAQPGLQLVPNTQTAFGNSYYSGNPPTLHSTMQYHGEITDPTNTGTGLSDDVLEALNSLTDHLPVISDYSVVGVPHLALGDANGDGAVDLRDFALLMRSDRSTGYYGWSNGDFNEDGAINADDFALFSLGLAAYQSLNTTVPEPAGAPILILISLSFLLRRQRDEIPT